MRQDVAERLLAIVMNWDASKVEEEHKILRLFSQFKYDEYQRFSVGMRFIESLARWLQQFETAEEKNTAYEFVKERLLFFPRREISHLVQLVYPDIVIPNFLKSVAHHEKVSPIFVGRLSQSDLFIDLKKKALFLGLTDGSRTDELRRSNPESISNEQIWHAYELSKEKKSDLLGELRKRTHDESSLFTSIWLLDDFSGSGKSYIRYDNKEKKYKGKIPKIFKSFLGEESEGNRIVDESATIHLVLYIATEMARKHIQEMANEFCKQEGFSEVAVSVVQLLPESVRIKDGAGADQKFIDIINGPYYNDSVEDKHTKQGGSGNVRFGFASCGLPVVLSHNTPNNSVYLIWAPEEEDSSFCGLFPRVSRHKEF